MMYEAALLRAEVKTLREANTGLAKRRNAKKSRLQEYSLKAFDSYE